MRKIIAISLLATLVTFSSCKKDDKVLPDLKMSNFLFQKVYNTGLQHDVYLNANGVVLSGRVPYEADITQLIANFNFVGSEVRIGDKIQTSNITINDFSEPITYTVYGDDGATKDYTVDVTWFTGLPIISITTENGEEINSRDDYVNGFVTINGGRIFDDGSGEMKIKGRGHSTWYVHPKKPYQLKFNEKSEVLGMPEDNKWIFLAEHSDKTLMRNSLAFEMGYISKLEWTPAHHYSEVFINDEYNGTYNITQKVEASENRVNIGASGFLCEIDTPDHLEEGDIYFNSTQFTVQIKAPEITFESQEYNYIKNHIIEFENVLYSSNFKHPQNGYRKYIDVETFVDWYLINEIAKNVDSKDYSSMYFYHVPGLKIKMGPLWDFDLGFGNVDYADSQYPDGFWVKDHRWFSRLFEDPYFVNQVKTRFNYFKSNQDYFIQFIDEKTEYLKYAQKENDKKWDVFGNYIWPNPVVYETHEEEVNYLKNWFVNRMNLLDEAFNAM